MGRVPHRGNRGIALQEKGRASGSSEGRDETGIIDLIKMDMTTTFLRHEQRKKSRKK